MAKDTPPTVIELDPQSGLQTDEQARPSNPETDKLLADMQKRIAELEQQLQASRPKPVGPVVVSDRFNFHDSDESHEERLGRLNSGPYHPDKELEKLHYGHHIAVNGVR